MKTAVLVHGAMMGATEWDRIVFGEPPNLLGRVPRALLTAHQLHAELVIFGTGSSKDPETGEIEADRIRRYFRDRPADLMQFTAVSDAFQGSEAALTAFIGQLSLQTELKSRNTVTELRYAGALARAHDIHRLVLVSSPTHLPRCLRDAMAEFAETWPQLTLLTAPSHTSYAGYGPANVVVFEPPHRPDTTVRFDDVASRFYAIKSEKRAAFHADLVDLIKRYE